MRRHPWTSFATPRAPHTTTRPRHERQVRVQAGASLRCASTRAIDRARARRARPRATARWARARRFDSRRRRRVARATARDARRDGARGTTSIVRVAGRRRASRARRDARRGRGRWVSTVARFKRETRRDETRRDETTKARGRRGTDDADARATQINARANRREFEGNTTIACR